MIAEAVRVEKGHQPVKVGREGQRHRGPQETARLWRQVRQSGNHKSEVTSSFQPRLFYLASTVKKYRCGYLL